MKAIIIKDTNGEVLFVAKVDDITETEFVNLQKESEENYNKKKENRNALFTRIFETLNNIKTDIRILKGEEE